MAKKIPIARKLPMKILIDTNILFSAILFENSRVAKAVFYANEHHDIFLTDQNVAELREVVSRKLPDKTEAINDFLAKLSYKIIPTASKTPSVAIRDIKDQPILNAAISNKIDIILTGDKDFLSLRLKCPRCLTVAEFLRLEGQVVAN